MSSAGGHGLVLSPSSCLYPRGLWSPSESIGRTDRRPRKIAAALFLCTCRPPPPMTSRPFASSVPAHSREAAGLGAAARAAAAGGDDGCGGAGGMEKDEGRSQPCAAWALHVCMCCGCGRWRWLISQSRGDERQSTIAAVPTECILISSYRGGRFGERGQLTLANPSSNAPINSLLLWRCHAPVDRRRDPATSGAVAASGREAAAAAPACRTDDGGPGRLSEPSSFRSPPSALRRRPCCLLPADAHASALQPIC